MDTPSLDEQIAAVRDQRDYLARSATWRAGRKGFNAHYHERDLARLDAAIETLRRMQGEAQAGG